MGHGAAGRPAWPQGRRVRSERGEPLDVVHVRGDPDYLRVYNYDRAHSGRLTERRVPADIVYGARKTTTVR
jgi:hypothetical protein